MRGEKNVHLRYVNIVQYLYFLIKEQRVSVPLKLISVKLRKSVEYVA